MDLKLYRVLNIFKNSLAENTESSSVFDLASLVATLSIEND